MMTALSVVIGIVCKNFFTFNVYYRITFENLPIMLAGLLFGPLAGAVCGGLSDVVSCLLSTNPAVNPIITAGAVSIGLITGIFGIKLRREQSKKTVWLAVYCAHLAGQVVIKSIAKIWMFGMPWWGVFVGLGVSIAVGAVEALIINKLLFDIKLYNKYGSNS